jgi:hypothetical protein
MVHDDFGTERHRLERVLDILDEAANRLNSASSDTEETEIDPPLSVCVQQHIEARSDDQLFLRASAPLRTEPPAVESVETTIALRCYARLIDEAAALQIGRPFAEPTLTRRT